MCDLPRPLRQVGFGYDVLTDAVGQTRGYRVGEVQNPGVAFSGRGLPLILIGSNTPKASLAALALLGFLVRYPGFRIVGFAYERHVIPVVMPTVFYLLWRWSRHAGLEAAGPQVRLTS